MSEAELEDRFEALVQLCRVSWSEAEVIAAIRKLRDDTKAALRDARLFPKDDDAPTDR